MREDGAKLKTVQIIGDAVISATPCLRLAASRVCLDLGQLWSDPSVSIVVQVGLEQLGGWAQILRALLEPCGSGFSQSVSPVGGDSGHVRPSVRFKSRLIVGRVQEGRLPRQIFQSRGACSGDCREKVIGMVHFARRLHPIGKFGIVFY